MRTLFVVLVPTALVATAALAAGMIYAAHQGVEQKGVTTARCDHRTGQVLLSIGGSVYVAEENGNTRAAVSLDAPLEITDLGLTPETLYIGRGIDRVVSAVPLNGNAPHLAFGGRPISRMTFQFHRFPSGRFVVSDTLSHKIRLHEADGREVTNQYCPYPNAILPWGSDQAVVLCTGTGTLALVEDAGRARIGHPRDAALALFAKKAPRGSHYEMARDPAGRLYVDTCLYEPGMECAVHRFDATAGVPVLVATLDATDLPTTNLDGELREVSMCTTRSGTLIVASDRYGEVLEFSNGRGGPPGEMTESPEIINPADLNRGPIALGPDNQVQRFGDAQIRDAAQDVRASRKKWHWMESTTKFGLYAVFLVLIALLIVYQQGGLSKSFRLYRQR